METRSLSWSRKGNQRATRVTAPISLSAQNGTTREKEQERAEVVVDVPPRPPPGKTLQGIQLEEFNTPGPPGVPLLRC